MDVNVTLDVGNNITDLITKLATQVGVTADKVFPWYVKEAYISGVTTVSVIGFLLCASLIIFTISAAFGKGREDNVWIIPLTVSGFLFVASLLVGSCEIGEAINKIYNPEKAAMSNLIHDLSKFSK